MENIIKKIESDKKIIDLEDNSEIEFWCKQLNCTKENLKYAVSRIGHSPIKINYFLELNRLKIQT
jgi:hypothetical protein